MDRSGPAGEKHHPGHADGQGHGGAGAVAHQRIPSCQITISDSAPLLHSLPPPAQLHPVPADLLLPGPALSSGQVIERPAPTVCDLPVRAALYSLLSAWLGGGGRARPVISHFSQLSNSKVPASPNVCIPYRRDEGGKLETRLMIFQNMCELICSFV